MTKYIENYIAIAVAIVFLLIGYYIFDQPFLLTNGSKALMLILDNYLTVASLFSGFTLLTISILGTNDSKAVELLKKHALFKKIVSFYLSSFISMTISVFLAFWLMFFIEINKINNARWLVLAWAYFVGLSFGGLLRSVYMFCKIVKVDNELK